MGRRCTGVNTVENSLKISIKDLKDMGLLAKDKSVISTLSWSVKTDKIASARYFKPINNEAVQLCYKVKGKEFNCKIDLVEIDSNLGVGKISFFICPTTGKNCKYLYVANGSPIWQSREAYAGSLCYSTQLSSKLNRLNDRYWSCQKSLEDHYSRKIVKYYAQKQTKRYSKILALEEEIYRLNRDRWDINNLPERFK